MRIIKKIIFYALAGFVMFYVSGCEKTNDLRSAFFSNVTAPASFNNTVKVSFVKDSRVDEKFLDIQVRSNKTVALVFQEENQDEVQIEFEDVKWNSLTTLVAKGKGEEGSETFRKYKEISSITMIFKTEQENVVLTLRAVVGEPEENATQTGYILTNSKEVSDEFRINLTKKMV